MVGIISVFSWKILLPPKSFGGQMIGVRRRRSRRVGRAGGLRRFSPFHTRLGNGRQGRVHDCRSGIVGKSGKRYFIGDFDTFFFQHHHQIDRQGVNHGKHSIRSIFVAIIWRLIFRLPSGVSRSRRFWLQIPEFRIP
jgi:hypothetical protein